MKKFLLLLLLLIGLTACGKETNINVVGNFINKIDNLKTYELVGTMEINNDEEVYNYDVKVDYLKKDYYKVQMLNKDNSQEQIILKNDDGLYVITPALNKSFKFDSTWPNNSSQAYILESLKNDLENDDAFSEEVNDGYVIKTNVNYPNNSELQYQKIYIDKDYNLKKVEVYSENDLPKIKIIFTRIDLDVRLDIDDFKLEDYVLTENQSATKTGKIENAIYPLYVPGNTYLSASEIVDNEDTNRIILTFSGDKNYVIVEEMAMSLENLEVIPVYGEPVMLNDTIGALSNNSMYWTSNDINYYLASDDLTSSEMVFIATSLTNAQTTLYAK